jgi:peptidoglycan hydrolase-like protein with peptidoglycan-binding domain
MRKLFLTAVSALALGIAGAAAGHAASPLVHPQSTTSILMAHPHHAPRPPLGTRAMNLSHGQIERVQQHLKAEGFYRGPIDGQMSAQTRQAIARFQQQNRLPSSGVVNRRTLAALYGLSNGVATTQRPKRQASGTSGRAGAGAPNRAGR